MRLTHPLLHARRNGGPHWATIDGERRWRWYEVADRVARVAAGLMTVGAAAGERVAILAHNCDDYFIAYFACPWAGAVLVPINTRLAASEVAFQLCDAGVTLLLYGQGFEALARSLHADGAVARIAALEGDGEALSLGGWCRTLDPIDAVAGSDHDLAAIFYTGGTTGVPKGVMLSHASLYTMACNLLMVIPFDADCVAFHAAPMFHLADIATLMTTMVAGTHVFERSFDADTILRAIAHHRVTHCFTVPAVIDRMARSDRSGLDLSSLRVLGYGGSSMLAASLDLARQAFPGVDFVQGFGQTEFPAATCLAARDHRPGAPVGRLRSCGQPCPDYEVRIVGEDGGTLPAGIVGEIVGRGGNMMLGYWNRAAETAEVLRDGWIHTRDAGYIDEDGYIYITDRLKDMIVSGAENVYSIEVENALSWHPAVDECAVIGLPDPQWGERVHAVVVAAGDAVPTLAELADFCRLRIAGYKVPRSLTLWNGPLPRSAAGKVLKRDLRDAV